MLFSRNSVFLSDKILNLAEVPLNSSTLGEIKISSNRKEPKVNFLLNRNFIY